MFAFVKNHGQKLALLLLASQLAITAVLASPSEFDLETPTDSLLARAVRGSGKVGATCKTNATCYSANCVTASDGVKKTCQRQPPGGPCFENGNCNTRQTRSANPSAKAAARKATNALPASAVPTYADFHDSCTSIFECTSPAICGSDNKCITPGNNTLVPNKICAADSQCTSHRCVGDQYQQDANGAIVSIRYGRYPERCDYFDNGESGCSTFYDCKGGFCKNGTCGPGKDGDRCQFKSHCTNLCSTTGYCFTPTRRQNRGAPCRYDSNCISKYCIYGNITRNRLSDGAPTLLPDYVCGPSFEGRPCGVDTDCDRGSCPTSTKICTVQPLGATCNFDSECNTSYCQKSSSGSGSGTCALAPYYTTCNSDDTCYSKDCGELPDPDPQPCLHDYYGEGCP
ncbi:hypothetical protein CF327_g2508 [Tilletia walkeri]|nr:hypothetical protein CF327_g2508 [Tilletia walkeri]